MRRVASVLLCLMLIVGIGTSQQTPSSILSSGAAFYALGPRELEISQSTLLSLLVYGTVVSPSSILSNGAAFYALSDRDLLVAQTYLLSQVSTNSSGSGSGTFNAAALTNWPNTTATNLSQRITTDTTIQMVNGAYTWRYADNTVGWKFPATAGPVTIGPYGLTSTGGFTAFAGVFTGDGSGVTNLPLLELSNHSHMAGTALAAGDGYFWDGSQFTNGAPTAVATLPAGVLTNNYSIAAALSNSLTLANNNSHVINIISAAGTKGSITASELTGGGIVLAATNSSGVFLKMLDATLNRIVVTNVSGLFQVYSDTGGNIAALDNGTVTADIGINSKYWIGYFDSRTNAWTTNTAFPLGATNGIANLSANAACGITGVSGTGTVNDVRYGIVSLICTNGDVVFTNPASINSSDKGTSRTFPNGTYVKLRVEWKQGLYTNINIETYGGSGIQVVVAAKTANYTVLTTDSGTFFNNTGAVGARTNTLPTAAVGLHYSFYVDAAQILCVKTNGAAASDVIRYTSTVSSTDGTIFSSTIGSTLHLFSPKANLWVVDTLAGTWSGPN